MPQWIGRLDIAMCTFAENDCDTTEYENSDTPDWIWFTYPGNFWDIPYINAFGNLVIDSLFADTFEKYETPSADNGYNYFASPTAAAEDGFVMPEFTDGKYCHITAEGMNKDNLTIPEDEVSTIAEEYDFYIGTPIVGSNYVSEVTVRLYITQRKYQEMTVSYGDTLQLPTPTRTGYSFLHWQTADGIEFGGGNVLFSAGTTELYLYAQYDNLFLAPLLYSLLGVAVLSSAVVAVAFTVKRRRAAVLLAAENEVVAVDDELGSHKANTSMLTSREKEVLELLLEGKQRKEIASILFLSENTIKKQITSIYQKLSVSSRSELFALFR
jgi:Response regulator containing a CheY-like receiver domain and an HTH DNA-binding domain